MKNSTFDSSLYIGTESHYQTWLRLTTEKVLLQFWLQDHLPTFALSKKTNREVHVLNRRPSSRCAPPPPLQWKANFSFSLPQHSGCPRMPTPRLNGRQQLDLILPGKAVRGGRPARRPKHPHIHARPLRPRPSDGPRCRRHHNPPIAQRKAPHRRGAVSYSSSFSDRITRQT